MAQDTDQRSWARFFKHASDLKCNIKYIQSYTTLYFITLYWIIIPATCFGPIESIINFTLHLFRYQPEDGPTAGTKHVAGIIIYYNLIKYKVVYDCIIYILYYILAYI